MPNRAPGARSRFCRRHHQIPLLPRLMSSARVVGNCARHSRLGMLKNGVVFFIQMLYVTEFFYYLEEEALRTVSIPRRA